MIDTKPGNLLVSDTMTALAILYIIDIVLLSTSATRVTPCGMFEFHSPQRNNNAFIVKEKTSVNITFTLLSLNCSNMSFDYIDISQKDLKTDMFGPQCVIYETCKRGPFRNNRSCQCLGEHGLYSFSFFATRQDSTLWKWSTANRMSTDAIIEIIVTYPPRVISMGKTGNDRPIPRHKSVLIYCSWENSNPPSIVRLLDRHGNVLASGNNSGNISYTFQAVDCNNTGTILCVSNGAQENITLLVECPPEILIPPPKIRIISAEENTGITFPFRSHEPHVTACHFTLLNRNKKFHNISISGTASFTCTNASVHFTLGRMYCIYFVTGIPPDLQLTLQVYNVQTEDVGLWYVNVSNNKGSDGMYIQVERYNEEDIFSESRNEGKSLDYNQSTFNVVRRRSVTSPYQTTTPPRTESDKSSSKTSSYNEVDDLELTARIREEADSVEYTRPSPPTAHAHSTRTALSSHAERLIAVPQEAVTIEQAARAQQPEYVEIENEVRPNGDDGYLVPAGQYASLNPATRSEEGHEYENLGSRPTESSSTPGYSGLVKSTKREKHLYDRLRRETNQTIEAEEEDPTYAIALEQMPGPTFTKL